MIHSIIKYLIGLFIITIGINFSIITDLGVSAVNSVPYAISEVSGVPFYICVILVFSFYVFLQYLILKKDFKWTHLFQLVCVTIFGQFVALTGYFINSYIVADTIMIKIILLCSSVCLIALGISMYMQANIILLPVEGLSFAISQKNTKYPFATIKTALDILFIIVSVCVGLCFSNKIIGVGIGTILSAIMVGKLIPYTNKIAEKI